MLSYLVGTSESTTVEWKQSLSEIKEIIATISAFANTEGGRIFVGVSNEGKIIEIHVGKSTLENLVNQIHQQIEPKIHPKITEKEVEDKEIIIIEVKES